VEHKRISSNASVSNWDYMIFKGRAHNTKIDLNIAYNVAWKHLPRVIHTALSP
jgi:hypothetical protein